MLRNRISTTVSGVNFAAVGRAVNWFATSESRPGDIGAALASVTRLPVNATIRDGVFRLDEGRLSKALDGRPHTDFSLWLSKVESNFDWAIEYGAPGRTQRYGSVGKEAMTGVNLGETVGCLNLELNLSVPELIDTLVDAEVARFPKADDLLRKRVERQLGEVRKFAALEERNACAFVPFRSSTDSFLVYSPTTSTSLVTSTGRVAVPEGSHTDIGSFSESDALKAYLDLLDLGETNASADGQAIVDNISSGSPHLQLASLNTALVSAESSQIPGLGAILVDSNDAAFWYLLVKAAFIPDRTVGVQINHFGFTTLREAFLYASQGSRFIAQPVYDK